ncbi:MAG: hypothetical protein VX784_05170 [Pseudomonadota bacterium]|nr:hypothetical protein [Pseudomonadota bacterium]
MIDSQSTLIVDDYQMFHDSLAFLIKKTLQIHLLRLVISSPAW